MSFHHNPMQSDNPALRYEDWNARRNTYQQQFPPQHSHDTQIHGSEYPRVLTPHFKYIQPSSPGRAPGTTFSGYLRPPQSVQSSATDPYGGFSHDSNIPIVSPRHSQPPSQSLPRYSDRGNIVESPRMERRSERNPDSSRSRTREQFHAAEPRQSMASSSSHRRTANMERDSESRRDWEYVKDNGACSWVKERIRSRLVEEKCKIHGSLDEFAEELTRGFFHPDSIRAREKDKCYSGKLKDFKKDADIEIEGVIKVFKKKGRIQDE